MTINQQMAEQMQTALLTWYAEHRRTLPWRGSDAYGVWISEIMLQQTQVATVIPYYQRFMASFPTVQALATATQDEVLQHWSGLGYYARARNLYKAAGEIVSRFGGVVPNTQTEILTLPGIGSYTSGAVLSIAYGVPLPAVDANVIRVVCRLFGIAGDPKSGAVQKTIFNLTSDIVPAINPGDFNQAMMELGALVCDPAEPNCEACPLLHWCGSGNSDNPVEFPEYPAAAATINKIHSCVVVTDENQNYLIMQRHQHGLWGGLWEFPRVVCEAGENAEAGARRAVLEAVRVSISTVRALSVVKHTVTRYRITLNAFTAVITEEAASNVKLSSDQYQSLKWVSLAELSNYALSSPQSIVRNCLRM